MGRKTVLAGFLLLLSLLIGLVGRGGAGLPELHLQKIVLEPPSPVARGEVVVIHAWVMNTGDRPAGEFKVEFFYRRQGGEKWTSFHVVVVPNLAPSRQEALEVKDDGRGVGLDTGGLEPGAYEVRVVADSNNQIPEEDETNNELVTALTVLPSKLGLADLQPVAVSLNPPLPTADQLVVVTVEVRNTGDKAAGPFRVSFRINGREFDSTSLEGLAAGASLSAQGALDPYALGLGPGSHTLLIVVDPDGQVDEQDEANNELTASLTIQGAELHPTSLELDKPVIRLDGRVTVSSKVVNTGKGPAQTVEVGFYIDGRQFALASLGALGPGEEALAQGELIPAKPGLGLAPGVHQLSVVVDPNNLIPELDEANNRLTKAVTILPPEPQLPELHPQSLELNPPSPVELRRAEVVTVSSVIKNTGKAPAIGFAVAFGYRVKGRVRWEALPCRDQAGCTNLALAPGAELKVEGKLALAPLSPGIYEVRVVVDPPTDGDGRGQVEELEEMNNELVTTLTLLSPRLPDLVLDPLAPVVVAPGYQVSRGQTLRFMANIANLGDLEAGPFAVEFAYCRLPESVPAGAEQPCTKPTDFSTFATVSLPGLAVGKKIEAGAVLETSALQPGSYLIRITLDPPDPSRPNGLVEEQSELNNVMDITVLVQGADLIPIALVFEPPSPVVQGAVVKVTATVINAGVEPTGKFDVNFYWCRLTGPTSCQREAEFVSFGGVSFPGIAVNNPEPASRALDTSALEPGDYLIRVVVDPDGRVAEQNEANNALTATLRVEPRPTDLRPEPWLAFEPEPPITAPAPVKVRGAIVNSGGTAAGEFRVSFLYRKVEEGAAYVPFDSVTLPGLGPGERMEVLGVLDTTRLTGGTYEICILADPDDKVKEADEANNIYCTPPPFVVISPPPDLWPKPQFRFEPQPPVPAGQPVKVYAEVANLGGSPAGKFSMAFLYRKIEEGIEHEYVRFDSAIVPRLGAGEQREIVGVLDTSGLPGGAYEICVVVDPDDFVAELDETNNTYCTPPPFVVIGAAGRADLVPVNLVIKPSPILQRGQTAQIYATIKNEGPGPAGKFTVQFVRRANPSGEVVFATREVSQLGPGETITLQVSLSTSGLAYGDYVIAVVVDPEDRVKELDEGNNRIQVILSII
jgi:subtilase family serine protease